MGTSRFAANVFSGVNENTLALGSLKLDFSMIKYEAPMEFSGLGAALSSRRRTDAEDGLHHKTARRLAALFEQLIPSTPKLITAYGLRSSQIIQTPGVNPKGSSKHGPFESFVGADGTAMWAAATSGVPALGVYLLACLLARAFDAKDAISTWVELVEERRKAILEDFRSNNAVSDSSLNSIRQDIRRDELARWDASARAWLLSADQVKIKEQTQLMLILKNCQLPFDGGIPYSKVIATWRQALSGLEDLLCGRPQEISNGSIPLAFSAWHLYPNLIVLGSEVKDVKFNDPLVDPRGVGTIALEPRSPTENQGTTWSLTLSHLRYYGDPVTVHSNVDFSRVTIDELHIVALGSILSAWGIGQRDNLAVLQWFVDLWEFIHVGASHKSPLTSLDWLEYFAKAAKKVLLSDTRNNSPEHQLLAYGRRRVKKFLGDSREQWPLFFGLSKPSILNGLAEGVDEERAIAYLREFAMENSYRSSDVYISSGWRYYKLTNAVVKFGQYLTAVPHACASRKRDADGNRLTEVVHARWLYCEVVDCPQGSADLDLLIEQALKERLQRIAARGERCTRIRGAPYAIPPDKDWAWRNPPLLFNYQKNTTNSNVDSYSCPSIRSPSILCPCFDCDDSITKQTERPSLHSPVWIIGQYSIFAKDNARDPSSRVLDDGIKIRGGWYLKPTISANRISKSSMKADTVLKYLQHMMDPAPRHSEDGKKPKEWYGSTELAAAYSENAAATNYMEELAAADSEDAAATNYIEELADKWPIGKTHLWALKALTIATHVYRQLDEATISLKVVETPLDKVSWLTEHKVSYRTPRNCERLNTLACIAHFESGGLHIEPDELDQTLAIASGNSIFVIGTLLSDPFENLAAKSVQRITGNIGRSGVCMLVAPFEPRIRPLGTEYNLVEHASYDGKRENNFKGTSLHLSFTDWTLPLEVKGAEGRTIDQEAYLVESVISVLDSGKWVADLDILGIDFMALRKLLPSQHCPGHPNRPPDYDYTSLDSWEELLDGPTGVGFFRAHGNWAARLAAVSILCQKNQFHAIGVLGPEAFCLDCLSSDYDDYGELEEHESPLPSFCID